MERRTFLKLCTFAATLPALPFKVFAKGKSSFTFAFGSCNDQEKNQDHWNVIADENPEGWIWLGDCIYADDFSTNRRKAAYTFVKSQPAYRRMISGSRFTLGTWDDHDYGANNAGEDYGDKEGSKRAFLEFMDEPEDSDRWRREGIYSKHEATIDGGKVLFLILDLRYFKPRQSSAADLLGDAQWQWLEDELRGSDADLIVIGSSIQCLPDFTEKETWSQYPRSRQQLLDLLKEVNKPALILSGDRHFTEFSRMQLTDDVKIYEFTASGLTHSSDRRNDNRYRVGSVVYERNFGLVKIEFSNGEPIVTLTAKSPENGEVINQLTAKFRD